MKGSLSGSERMIQSETGGGMRATGKGGSECHWANSPGESLEGFHYTGKVNVWQWQRREGVNELQGWTGKLLLVTCWKESFILGCRMSWRLQSQAQTPNNRKWMCKLSPNGGENGVIKYPRNQRWTEAVLGDWAQPLGVTLPLRADGAAGWMLTKDLR